MLLIVRTLTDGTVLRLPVLHNGDKCLNGRATIWGGGGDRGAAVSIVIFIVVMYVL